MDRILIQVLLDLPHRSEFVFTRPDGEPVKSIRKSFRSILKKAKIENFKLYDLKDTFASYAVMEGTDLVTVMELLGQKSLDMVLKYAYLSPDHKRRAVETVEKRYQEMSQSVHTPEDVIDKPLKIKVRN